MICWYTMGGTEWILESITILESHFTRLPILSSFPPIHLIQQPSDYTTHHLKSFDSMEASLQRWPSHWITPPGIHILNLGWLCNLLLTNDAMWLLKVGHKNFTVSARTLFFRILPLGNQPPYCELLKLHDKAMNRRNVDSPSWAPSQQPHQWATLGIQPGRVFTWLQLLYEGSHL